MKVYFLVLAYNEEQFLKTAISNLNNTVMETNLKIMKYQLSMMVVKIIH